MDARRVRSARPYQRPTKFQVEFPGPGLGLVYEHKLAQYLHQYLGILPIDRVCYVGSCGSNMPKMIANAFELSVPVTSVLQCQCSDRKHGEAESGDFVIYKPAANYFRLLKNTTTVRFDHVIVSLAETGVVGELHLLTEILGEICQTLTKHGKMLLLCRPSQMTTLPLFGVAREKLAAAEQYNYSQLITETIYTSLLSRNMDVNWDIHTLPSVLPQDNWLRQLANKETPISHCDLNTTELRRGIREIQQGVFSYQPPVVEFYDRLLFIVAEPTGSTAIIRRLGADISQPKPISFDVPLTAELRPYVAHRLKPPPPKLDRSEYGMR